MRDDHYTYRISWSPEDSEFVASVVEFTSLSWLAPDPAGALLGLRALVAEVVEDLRSDNVPTAASRPALAEVANGDLARRLAVETLEAMGAAPGP